MQTLDKHTFDEIIQNLDVLMNDMNAPQNVQRGAQKLTTLLGEDAQTVEEKKNRALEILQEMVDDQNIKMDVRTLIYHMTALFESLNNGI